MLRWMFGVTKKHKIRNEDVKLSVEVVGLTSDKEDPREKAN